MKPLILALVLLPTLAQAEPIIASTVQGCVTLADLAGARWFAQGTMQIVAFDDDQAGCEPTIQYPVMDAYAFDEDRIGNTLTAWVNLFVLPACGRRQYDVELYGLGGVLLPLTMRSLVLDTGIDCVSGEGLTPEDPPRGVPEPGIVALLVMAAIWRLR
jgi:hypothetical protein